MLLPAARSSPTRNGHVLPKLGASQSCRVSRLSEPVLAREAMRLLSTQVGEESTAATVLAEAHLARRSTAVSLSQAAAAHRPRSAPLGGPVCNSSSSAPHLARPSISR